jgi:hypothetical protein
MGGGKGTEREGTLLTGNLIVIFLVLGVSQCHFIYLVKIKSPQKLSIVKTLKLCKWFSSGYKQRE